MLHCGNITDGYLRGPTHVEHIKNQGYYEMLAYIEEIYPNIGVPTYFIGGRNERTFFKRVIRKEKTNVCEDIEDVRGRFEILRLAYRKSADRFKHYLSSGKPQEREQETLYGLPPDTKNIRKLWRRGKAGCADRRIL